MQSLRISSPLKALQLSFQVSRQLIKLNFGHRAASRDSYQICAGQQVWKFEKMTEIPVEKQDLTLAVKLWKPLRKRVDTFFSGNVREASFESFPKPRMPKALLGIIEKDEALSLLCQLSTSHSFSS